jgi:SPP1 gp7 family putative phage head morphogenesis protein
LLSGETTDDIVRSLMGNLEFGQRAGTPLQAALSGDAGFKMARHQIKTIVRTSVNQVSNVASKRVYKANKEVTEKYEYVATLDSRTSALCASLDGQEFEYDKGPEPPQHFNCRSTTVAVIDWEGLRKKYPQLKFDDPGVGKRAAAGGTVPADTTYGKWLHDQRKPGTKFTPGPRQIEALGKEKAKYFNRLAGKYGPDEAIKKFVRTDGTEISLAQLRKRYPKLTSITAAQKTSKISDILPAGAYGTEEVDAFAKQFGGIEKFVSDSLTSLETVGGEIAANSKKMRKFIEKSDMINHFNMTSEKKWSKSMINKIPLAAFQKQMASTTKAFEKFPKTADNKASWRWYERLRRAVDAKDKNLIYLRFDDVMKPASARYAGYTTTPSSIVNTALSSKTTQPLLKKDVDKFISGAKKSLENYTYTTGNEIAIEHQWLNTMIHEIGHQVHFKGSGASPLGRKFSKLGGKTSITYYSEKDKYELFAESFAAYITSPDLLLKDSPRLYNWVKETFDAALDYL